MPGIIEFPKVVQDALDQYGDLFANQCQRRHFAEYLTGLFVAQRKTILGIHDEFAQTTDQSCLNRFMTEVPWDVQTLNQRRLERLQEDPFTRYSDHGVIAIDNTLIDRDGQLIPERRLVLGSRRGTEQDRPGLPLRSTTFAPAANTTRWNSASSASRRSAKPSSNRSATIPSCAAS